MTDETPYQRALREDKPPEIRPEDELLRSWRAVAQKMNRQMLALQDLHTPTGTGYARTCSHCRDETGTRLLYPCPTMRTISP